MANYYIQFIETIPDLTAEEKAWVEKELIPPFEQDEDESWPGFSWAIEDGDLSIFSDENGVIDHVGIFVQRFLAQWRPEVIFTLTWADTCSSLRLGTFSGGWLVVSKDEIVYGNAYCEAEQAAHALKTGDFKA